MKTKDAKGISKENTIFFVISGKPNYKKAVKLSKILTVKKPFSNQSFKAPIIDYVDYLDLNRLFENFIFAVVMITEQEFKKLTPNYKYYEL